MMRFRVLQVKRGEDERRALLFIVPTNARVVRCFQSGILEALFGHVYRLFSYVG